MKQALGILLLLGPLGCAARSAQPDAPCTTAPGHRYVDVSAYGGRTCAVRVSGEVDCWGIGYGDGRDYWKDEARSIVLGVDDATSVDVGRAVCVTRADRTHAVCFDDHGGPIESQAPLSRVVSGGAGECALTESGRVLCWGKNDRGQLGIDERTRLGEVTAPVELPGLSGVRQIDMGAAYGCGVDRGGKVWCWGYGRASLGRSASGTPEPQALPLEGAVHVATGREHGCAVLEDGGVRCWGSNDRGQLGSSGKSTGLPVEVAGVTTARQVAAGLSHTCALLADGEVACWGSEPRREKRGVRAVQLDEPAKLIAAGAEHDCALLRSGRLSCWGRRPPLLQDSCR